MEIGELAPLFSLKSDEGTKIDLADLKGKNVVLYFYPKDDTPGCTIEAQAAPRPKHPYCRSSAIMPACS